MWNRMVTLTQQLHQRNQHTQGDPQVIAQMISLSLIRKKPQQHTILLENLEELLVMLLSPLLLIITVAFNLKLDISVRNLRNLRNDERTPGNEIQPFIAGLNNKGKNVIYAGIAFTSTKVEWICKPTHKGMCTLHCCMN